MSKVKIYHRFIRELHGQLMDELTYRQVQSVNKKHGLYKAYSLMHPTLTARSKVRNMRNFIGRLVGVRSEDGGWKHLKIR